MNKAIPHICPVCKYRPESYYGLLVFPGPSADDFEAVAANGGSLTLPDKPLCPNHKQGYSHELEPVTNPQPPE